MHGYSFFSTGGRVIQIELSPDELSVVVVAEAETGTTLYYLRIADLLYPGQAQQPTAIATRRLEKNQKIVSLSFSKDSSWLILCQSDERLLVLSCESGDVLRQKTIAGITYATWDYGGNILFGDTEGIVRCLEYENFDSTEANQCQVVAEKPNNLESRKYAGTSSLLPKYHPHVLKY
jgi:WD40 repeat protein